MTASRPGGALFTIGYQGARLADLVACLAGAGVATLADIRYEPFSRRPEFRQGPLRAALAAAGIGYVHCRALGNPPPSRAAALAGDMAGYRRLFQAHLDTDAARAALAQVAGLMDDGPVCLMCLERRAEECHRLMVAERLACAHRVTLLHLRVADRGGTGCLAAS